MATPFKVIITIMMFAIIQSCKIQFTGPFPNIYPDSTTFLYRFGFRFRNLSNSASQGDIYLGSHDLGTPKRVEGGGGSNSFLWDSTNSVEYTFNASATGTTKMLNVKVTNSRASASNNSIELGVAANNPVITTHISSDLSNFQKINYMTISFRTQQVGKTIKVNNLRINEVPIGTYES
jgi:hypothetical protein